MVVVLVVGFLILDGVVLPVSGLSYGWLGLTCGFDSGWFGVGFGDLSGVSSFLWGWYNIHFSSLGLTWWLLICVAYGFGCGIWRFAYGFEFCLWVAMVGVVFEALFWVWFWLGFDVMCGFACRLARHVLVGGVVLVVRWFGRFGFGVGV